MIKVTAERSSERFRRRKNKLYRVDKPLLMPDGQEINSHFITGENDKWVFTSLIGSSFKPTVAFEKKMIVRGA